MPARALVVVVAVVLLVAFVAVAGTYVAYFIAAMRRPPHSPFTIACKQLAPPSSRRVRVRFDVVSTAPKEATYLNFALFAVGANRLDLSDWEYPLQSRAPARGNFSTTVAIPLPSDYAGIEFSGVRCNLINAAFADGSQQDYTASNATFP